MIDAIIFVWLAHNCLWLAIGLTSLGLCARRLASPKMGSRSNSVKRIRNQSFDVSAFETKGEMK